jgi:hypothetical protein
MPDQLVNNFTTRQLHILHVYNDPDFVNEMKEILEYNKSSTGKAFTFGDTELLDTIFKSLLEKWCLSLVDIRNYIFRLSNRDTKDVLEPEIRYLLNPNLYITSDGINIQDQYSSIVFDIDHIKKQDFLEMWESIRKVQKIRNQKFYRTRATSDYDLIYAIFKQRQQKVTFKAIFDMYVDGKLPGYNNKPKIGSTRDSEWLHKHYDRYKPTIPLSKEYDIQHYYLNLHKSNVTDEIIAEYDSKKHII